MVPVLLEHPSSLAHDTGSHPEQAARILAIERELSERQWLGYERLMSQPVERSVLCAVHPEPYVASIERVSAAGGGQLDLDTVVSKIIEFGYENSREGVNSAKTEYCLDKQKQNIAHPYKGALREAAKSKQAVEGLHGLHEAWLSALAALPWHSGESDDDYKARVAKPYETFNERIASIRTSVTVVETPPTAPKSAKPAKATKPKSAKAKKS